LCIAHDGRKIAVKLGLQNTVGRRQHDPIDQPAENLHQSRVVACGERRFYQCGSRAPAAGVGTDRITTCQADPGSDLRPPRECRGGRSALPHRSRRRFRRTQPRLLPDLARADARSAQPGDPVGPVQPERPGTWHHDYHQHFIIVSMMLITAGFEMPGSRA
jgi:hypothetical protein